MAADQHLRLLNTTQLPGSLVPSASMAISGRHRGKGDPVSETRHLTAGSFPPGPWLEIVRGRTSFPCRPVRGDRFLIGAGSQCDLQLGGANIPLLHSVIVVDSYGATIEAFTPTPELLINGQPQRSVSLRHQDTIEVGRIQLLFHNPAAALPPATDEEFGSETPDDAIALPSLEALEMADTSAVEMGELTVEQLITRLDEEQSAIDSLDQRRLAGAQALLDAIRRAGAEEALDQASDAGESGDADGSEIESIPIRPLDDEWDERERQLLEMEQNLAAKAAELATVQDRLAEQIDQIREHVRQLESPDEPEALRISA
jgi:hypothetical protein